MDILLIGSGGREHSAGLEACRLAAIDELYCAPGNPGIAREAELRGAGRGGSRGRGGFC